MNTLLVTAGLSLSVGIALFWLAGHGIIRDTPQPPAWVAQSGRRRPLFWQWLGGACHIAGYWLKQMLPHGVDVRVDGLIRRAGYEWIVSNEEVVGAPVVAAVGGLSVVLGLMLLGADLGGAALLFAALLAAVLPLLWLAERAAARVRMLGRELPFYLDLLTLALEGGAGLSGALHLAAHRGPPGVLADELKRVMIEMQTGQPRAEALQSLARRWHIASLDQWVAAMATAERQGSNLGPVLRVQADQCRQERFLRAEALALKAPVKLMLPLLLFIFPCTFLVLFFPIVFKVFEDGWLG